VTHWIVPGLLSGLTAVPALWFGQAFLAKQPDGFSQLALYSAAYGLMGIVLFLPNVTNAVGMSLINHALGGGVNSEYQSAFWLNLRATLLITLLGVVALLLTGPLLLRLYGTSFTAAYSLLFVLLVASLPESATIAINQVLQSKGMVWRAILTVNVPRDAAIVAGAYLLAPRFGALGLAVAYLTGRIIALGCILNSVRSVGLLIPREAMIGIPVIPANSPPP
jgi:O-antigen/teichoic acid export membrane protein